MKAIHLIKTFLLLALVATVSVRCSCDDKTTPAKTITQIIASGNVWKISVARVGSIVQPLTAYAAFRVTFTAAGNYTITRGGAPFSPSKSAAQTGTWKLATNNADLTLDAGATLRNVTLSNVKETPTVTATITWIDDEDKTKPQISFDLVPAL